MTYLDAVTYLESFVNYEKKIGYPYKRSFKLERVRDFLRELGDPHRAFKSIHVAGTKGKGSTCAFTSYILREAGFKVGLYTSPHLSDCRERIRILRRRPSVAGSRGIDFEGMISKAALTKLVCRLRPQIERFNRRSRYGALSFFEVYTALAFTYFKEKRVDIAVIETGLGGRLDATNVVDPLVSCLTPISFDHMHKLGHTLAEIAGEKAGIIKSSAPPAAGHTPIVISAPQQKEAIQVIRKRCSHAGAVLLEVGKDNIRQYKNGAFIVKGSYGVYPDLKIRLKGQHQYVNAAVSVAIADSLQGKGIKIEKRAISRGLYDTRWPGRCEVVSKKPLVVVDGAQNSASSIILVQAVRNEFKYKRLILVLGISKDKDIEGVCKELSCLADEVVLTRAANPRAAEPATLAKEFKKKSLHITANVRQAMAVAAGLATGNDLILVCGSLFVVGECRSLFIPAQKRRKTEVR